MPKVNITLLITDIHIKLFFFQGGTSGFKVGLGAWRGGGGGEGVEEEEGRLLVHWPSWFWWGVEGAGGGLGRATSSTSVHPARGAWGADDFLDI